MVSKKILRMGAQKTPIQKTYEIKKGSNSLNVEFLGSNRQFDWIEISIVPDKSDKHTTIYDSYNREMAACCCCGDTFLRSNRYVTSYVIQ